MTDAVRDVQFGVIGIASAIAAGAVASRNAQIDRARAQIDARIEGRLRIIDAKAARNQALRRKLAALNALAGTK